MAVTFDDKKLEKPMAEIRKAHMPALMRVRANEKNTMCPELKSASAKPNLLG
jgi:hypothetical protein